MRYFLAAALPLCWICLARAADHPAPIVIPESEAQTEAEMKPYTELIEHTDARIDMLPIKGGRFLMGSPEGEKGRYPDEGPQHEVEITFAQCRQQRLVVQHVDVQAHSRRFAEQGTASLWKEQLGI